MKKVLALSLSTVLVLGVLASCGKKREAIVKDSTLTIATTQFNGDFMAGFGNSSYDNNIRKAIGTDMNSSTGVIAITPEGEFVVNKTVVKDNKITENQDGSKTYDFTINKGLKFSDGSDLKASDFVFAVKLLTSPTYRAAGSTGVVSKYSELVGHEAWMKNTAKDFEGVKLVDEDTFSLTVASEFLPNFYDLQLVAAFPLNEKVLTNNGKYKFDIVTDETGKTAETDYLGKYVVDTFKSNPKGIASGPYEFVEYVQKQFVKLKANEFFAGDYTGQTPIISEVVIKVVGAETDIDELIKGDVDILEGQIEGTKIQKALAKDNIKSKTYLRNGYGYLAFHTDMPIVNDVRVRQAIGYLIDREKFVEAFLGGPDYGSVIDSTYGLGSWEAKDSKVIKENKLTHYSYDLEKATKLLNDAGWNFNETGAAYVAGENKFRYNAAGEIMQLNWLSTEENQFTELLSAIALKGFTDAGIKLDLVKTDFPSMYNEYQAPTKGIPTTERKYHLFNLASSIPAGSIPYEEFSSKGSANNTAIKSPELDKVLKELRTVKPGDNAKFIEIWDKYITLNNELLPLLPMYSNTYYNLYNTDAIKEIEKASPFWAWPEEISYLKLNK